MTSSSGMYLRDLAPRVAASQRHAGLPTSRACLESKPTATARTSASRRSVVAPKPSSLKATYSREYQAWKVARRRCVNPADAMWRYYGGAGIKFHGPWLQSFRAFLDYVGPAPAGHALLRRDKRGHYEPGNVAWRPRGEARVGVGKHEHMVRTVPSARSSTSQNVAIEERGGLILIGGLKLDPNQADGVALELIRRAEELRRRNRKP